MRADGGDVVSFATYSAKNAKIRFGDNGQWFDVKQWSIEPGELRLKDSDFNPSDLAATFSFTLDAIPRRPVHNNRKNRRRLRCWMRHAKRPEWCGRFPWWRLTFAQERKIYGEVYDGL